MNSTFPEHRDRTDSGTEVTSVHHEGSRVAGSVLPFPIAPSMPLTMRSAAEPVGSPGPEAAR